MAYFGLIAASSLSLYINGQSVEGGVMAENRYKKRHRKRLSVNFGIDKVEKFGFTDDITHDGLFIRSAVVARPGVAIMIEIKHPQEVIALVGEVRWTKKIPSNVIHKLKGGMGVKIKSFQAGEELYHALCDELIEQRGG